MQQNCLWLHPNQVFKPGSSYDAQRIVLSISLLSACFAMQDVLNLFTIECISCLLPYAWRYANMYNASLCPQQCYSVGHTAFEAQHLRCSCLISVGYMVEKPSTVDEAIAYVWDVPDTVIGPADKQRLAAALAEKTDAVARRYFSAPNPELWVGTLRELLNPAGTYSRTSLMTCTPYVCSCWK